MEASADRALPGPEGWKPSRVSRLAAWYMRWFMRPVGHVLPVNRFGVAFARWYMLLASRFIRVGRRTRIEPVAAEFEGHPVDGEWVRGRDVRDGDAAILYLHGSGYVGCSPRTHRGMIARLSELTGLPVLAVDYRLAPEHPFPAAADDTFAAYRWLLDQGFDPDRVIVAGDSAGGHLALGLSVWCLREELELPAGLVLFSPLVDHSFELCAQRDRECPDPMFTNSLGKRMVALYSGQADVADPRLSLLECEADRLPRMLVQAGGREMLSADAEKLCEVIEAGGGSCELQVWPGQVHVFQMGYDALPEARLAMKHAARFVRDALSAPATEPATSTAAG